MYSCKSTELSSCKKRVCYYFFIFFFYELFINFYLRDIMEDDPEGYGSELSFLLTKVEINSQSNHTAVMSYIT